jgi:hypothetical protein
MANFLGGLARKDGRDKRERKEGKEEGGGGVSRGLMDKFSFKDKAKEKSSQVDTRREGREERISFNSSEEAMLMEGMKCFAECMVMNLKKKMFEFEKRHRPGSTKRACLMLNQVDGFYQKVDFADSHFIL